MSRKTKNRRGTSPSTSTPLQDADTASEPRRRTLQKPPIPQPLNLPQQQIQIQIQMLPMPASTRLLICSIGNPAPYTATLHSAGHTILTHLRAALSYPAFHRSRLQGNGLVSAGPEYTLWQSTTAMNVSGPAVLAAWRGFVRDAERGTAHGGSGEGLGLVVVHDELELGLGQVKVRGGEASPKGHNGLKSIRDALRGTGIAWTRIGVGIGRPESRDPDVVAGYVLKKMSAVERAKLEATVGTVDAELRRLKEGR